MPAPRKYPIRIVVDGKPVQVKSIGGKLFCSKKFVYQAEYDESGHLNGAIVHALKDSCSTPLKD
jgi:hypothetical protein